MSLSKPQRQVERSRTGRSFQVKKTSGSKSQPKPRVRTEVKTPCKETLVEKVCTLPRTVAYLQMLQHSGRYISLASNWVAIAQCSESGQLKPDYCLIEKLLFFAKESSSTAETCPIFVCSCKESINQTTRLKSTCTAISEDLSLFKAREEEQYCIHRSILPQLHSSDFPVLEPQCHEDSPPEPVAILSMSPLLAAVFADESFGIVSRQKRGYSEYKCTSCKCRQCSHLQVFEEWCDDTDFIPDPEEMTAKNSKPTISSVSWKSIPYPLPDDLRKLHTSHEAGKWEFPQDLVPSIAEGDCCQHGNQWDKRSPVENGWVADKGVTIYKESTAIHDEKRAVYYRPTVGQCTCRLQYDGQEHLLFNLDNKRFFYYGLLFQYLHLMLEGRNPLIAYQRSLQRTYSCLGSSNAPGLSRIQQSTCAPAIQFLRRAWYAFSQLLAVPIKESFLCPICGPSPETIVCDGTMVGFRKDLLSVAQTAPECSSLPQEQIAGSCHADRTLVKTKAARELLLTYAGYSRDRKRIARPRELSHTAFQQLCKILRSDGFKALADLLERLTDETGHRTAPDPYRTFLAEVARNSPACGMVQVAGNEDAMKVLHLISEGSIDVFSSHNHRSLKVLQETAPLIASFLAGFPKSEVNAIPQDVLAVIHYIITIVKAPFEQQSSCHHYPLPDSCSPFSFFPHLPQCHGNATYEADKHNVYRDLDSCRKSSYGHPTLTPGIFTIYCPHAICYGFEVLRECESPRHPFQIFKTRFSRPPHNIIYDNACRLHLYCLNREPVFFENTRFFVDRFHWRGHIGCSSGYCLDEYKSMNIREINSQVNEQANAGLQRIKGQLSYMTITNFVFHLSLFLAIKNLDIKQRIDLSRLHL